MHEPDLARLAAVHVACIRDSLIGALGERYVRAFYRYVTRSSSELLLIERNDVGEIVAAAVVSLDPTTLNARLLRQTRWIAAAVVHAPRVARMLWVSARRPRGLEQGVPAPHGTPELILIFTVPTERGRGRGAALVRQIDARLRERGVEKYIARTVSDPANRALAFYRANGFEPAGISFRLGTAFQMFTRTPPR